MAYTAQRCSVDDVNWPMAEFYSTCPICQQPTWRVWNEPALTPAAAGQLATEHRARITREQNFERYYTEREERRIKALVEEFIEEATAVAEPAVEF